MSRRSNELHPASFSEDNIITSGPGFTRRTLAFVVGAGLVMAMVFAGFIFLFNQEAERIKAEQEQKKAQTESLRVHPGRALALESEGRALALKPKGRALALKPKGREAMSGYAGTNWDGTPRMAPPGGIGGETVALGGDSSYIGMGYGDGSQRPSQVSQLSLNASSLRAVGPGGRHDVTTDPTNLQRSFERTVMGFNSPANMHRRPIDIQMKDKYAQEDKFDSVANDDIQLATKGDGTIRPVYINGKPVPRELVEDAMFRNQDFMYRTDQFPLHAKPLLADTSMKNQRSMFGKMTFPLAGLGMDVIRGDSTDTRVNVASTGGRFEMT